MLNKGEIVEEGPHEKLMAARGAYYQLVLKQVRKDGGSENSSVKSFQLDNKIAEEVLEKEGLADDEVEEVIEASNGGHVSINVDPSDTTMTKPKVMTKFCLLASAIINRIVEKYSFYA